METEFDKLALRSDHSLQDQEKILFYYNTLEEAIEKIKPKWAHYEGEKKENLIKLFKACYGEDIMNAIADLEEENISDPTDYDNEVTSDISEDPVSEIEEEQEEEIIIKCSLE